MMKRLNFLGPIMALFMMAAGNVAVADSATWVDTVQKAIASLDLSDAQKMDVGGAFDLADAAYETAIGDTRELISKTLTDDQKQGLAEMANDQIQKRLEGDTSARTKSIADIAKDLGVTDSQSATIKNALATLGDALDDIDANLVKSIKSILNKDQLAKIASWLS